MKKILIIHPEGNIKNNPNLYCFTKELVAQGFEVKVLSRKHPEIYQGEIFSGASFVYYDNEINRITDLEILEYGFSYIIGIDEGLIKAEKYAKILNIPYAFLSYELFFDNELKRFDPSPWVKFRRNWRSIVKHFWNIKKNWKIIMKGLRYEKKKMRRASLKVHFCIIQDVVRKDLLIKEYNVQTDKILLMPVAGSGVRRIKRSNYLHQKLNIPADKKILLYMGWINELQIKRLLSYGKHLPLNWVFVIHSRYRYAQNISDKMDKNVYFSFDSPIENIEDIGVLLSDCDAGFCSYQSDYYSPHTGDNIKYIGLSSGKTSTFLQYGIPVVVENMNIWDEIVEKKQIGMVLKNRGDLARLNSLLNDEISEKCMSFFEKHLDVKNFVSPIISKIRGDDL
jgi:hypothetical protein